MKIKKKREVWVTALSRERKYRIVDARSGVPYLHQSVDDKSLWGVGPSMSTWPTRESAEAFAKEQGWKVV